MRKLPGVVEHLARGDLPAALAAGREWAGSAETVGSALRRERLGLALTVAIGDLAGWLSFEDVVGQLSDFADRALDAAIAQAIAERTPGAEPTGFVALALGKHGSRELNYSSDIDPILLFDPQTLPRRAREEPEEAAVRVARRVVELLQARDAEGYVLRVDLRLRPSPEVTPIAIPIAAATSYYESLALPWERAAFIRARAAAGDVALGTRFLESIRPFVWRRVLDFGAIAEIQDISRRIRSHHGKDRAFGPGFDLKRGRGGIREIEFYAQIHQLIHGGRQPVLRQPATLPALHALAASGLIEADTAAVMTRSYRLFRTIEHRLQMVDDRQTHLLPEAAPALDGVARLHGLEDGAALLGLLQPHVEQVGTFYDQLAIGGATPSAGAEPDDLAARFPDPAHAKRMIARWRSGAVPALRSAAAQGALDSVLPALTQAFARAVDPMTALNRFDAMLSRLPSSLNLFRLLQARPGLAEMLGEVLAQAPTLADALARRPALLDGMIDASAFAPSSSVPELVARFAQRERDEDYQGLLDRVRIAVGEARFALGTQIVLGTSDPLEVAAGYSRVAEAALQTLGAATVAEFEAVHGRVPGGELVVLALGRLGGGALTHASDLDLIYLFTGSFAAESDGPRPLGATQYFNRLAQRVTAALSVPTPAGPLYEVDTRLRPSGNQGLLAVSTESFSRYEQTSAWTWEHMALTRARPVFGGAEARAEVAAIVADILGAPRDPEKLKRDAVTMRAEIARHKPAAGPFDVKLLPGGLVELEFVVHVHQLASRAGLDPRLAPAIEALAQAGLVPPELGRAYALLARMLVVLRLVAPGGDEPPPSTRRLVARACGMEDWPRLLAEYDRARQMVAAEWVRIAGS